MPLIIDWQWLSLFAGEHKAEQGQAELVDSEHDGEQVGPSQMANTETESARVADLANSRMVPSSRVDETAGEHRHP